MTSFGDKFENVFDCVVNMLYLQFILKNSFVTDLTSVCIKSLVIANSRRLKIAISSNSLQISNF